MTTNIPGEPIEFFKPEFVNRIDEIVRFHPLTQSDLARIVSIQLDGLRVAVGRAAPEPRPSRPRPSPGWPRPATTPTSGPVPSAGSSSERSRTRSPWPCWRAATPKAPWSRWTRRTGRSPWSEKARPTGGRYPPDPPPIRPVGRRPVWTTSGAGCHHGAVERPGGTAQQPVTSGRPFWATRRGPSRSRVPSSARLPW